MSVIMVYDVAAESGGALSVLKNYYNQAKGDLNNRYIFVLSRVDLISVNNIKVIKCEWVKKSWFHRLFMDFFFVKLIVIKHKVNYIISLQNHAIYGIKIKQMVYVHNALPFCEHRFRLIREPYLWIYQNLIGTLTKKSLRVADCITVQNEWMKNAIVRDVHINPLKVKVVEIVPDLRQDNNRLQTDRLRFFYPATPFVFKNHDVVLSACKQLTEYEREKIEIIFTFKGDENKLASQLARVIDDERLPIKLVGFLDSEDMVYYYKSSILLFPSYVETVGLPLKEAQYYSAHIVSADLEYARCSIGTYSMVTYFKYNDDIQLSEVIRSFINEDDYDGV